MLISLIPCMSMRENSWVDQREADGNAAGMAVSLDGCRAYITNHGSGTVSVIDTGVG